MEIKITNSTNFNEPSFEWKHPIEQEGEGKGVQKFWRFENGYGASVVRFEIKRMFGNKNKVGSYGIDKGLWELAVLTFKNDEFEITYNTELTHDVIGYLTEKEIEVILNKIKNLNKEI